MNSPSLPDTEQAPTPTEPASSLPTSITPEDARLGVQLAQMDFADIKARFGAKVALEKDYNRRVLRWAQEFTNPRIARVAYTIGCALDGTTHTRQISVNGGYANRSQEHAPGQLLALYDRHYASAGHTLSYKQFTRIVTYLANHGVMTRTRVTERQGEASAHPGAWSASIYGVDFSKVLVDDQVVPHDFAAPLPEPSVTVTNQNVPRDVPRDVPWTDPRDVPQSIDSSGSSEPSGSDDHHHMSFALNPTPPSPAVTPPEGGPGKVLELINSREDMSVEKLTDDAIRVVAFLDDEGFLCIHPKYPIKTPGPGEVRAWMTREKYKSIPWESTK
jgi:hypothetical protein